MKCNQCRPGFELVSPCPFPTTITVTPRAPPHIMAKKWVLHILQFQTIQFNISTMFNSILPIDRVLSGATSPSLSEPGSDGNKGVLCIPQSSSITGTSPSDCFVSYPGHSLWESYPSAERQSVYLTGPLLFISRVSKYWIPREYRTHYSVIIDLRI